MTQKLSKTECEELCINQCEYLMKLTKKELAKRILSVEKDLVLACTSIAKAYKQLSDCRVAFSGVYLEKQALIKQQKEK